MRCFSDGLVQKVVLPFGKTCLGWAGEEMGRGTLKVGVGRGRGAEPHCGDGGGEEDDDGDDDDDDDDDSGTEDTPSEDTEDDDGAGGGTRRDMAGDVPKARVRQSPHVWWRVGVQKAQCVIVLCTLMPLCLWGASHMVGLGFWRAGTFTFYSQHPSSVPRKKPYSSEGAGIVGVKLLTAGGPRVNDVSNIVKY